MPRTAPPKDPTTSGLPFVNLSDDQTNEYFSRELSEELVRSDALCGDILKLLLSPGHSHAT